MRRRAWLESPYAIGIMTGLGDKAAVHGMYEWTVTPGEIKQRRIKGKAQKAARKVNRRNTRRRG